MLRWLLGCCLALLLLLSSFIFRESRDLLGLLLALSGSRLGKLLLCCRSILDDSALSKLLSLNLHLLFRFDFIWHIGSHSLSQLLSLLSLMHHLLD